MDNNSYFEKLNHIQEQVDENYKEYIRKEFDIKLAHHKSIEGLLKERDEILKTNFSKEELNDFFENALKAFDGFENFTPNKADNKPDVSFIKYFTAEYLDGEKFRITLDLYENEYVKNTQLTRTINLMDQEPSNNIVEWKGEPIPCILFDFFETEEECLDLFDIIYELYVNMIAFASTEE